MAEPLSIRAGDSISWDVDQPLYSSSLGWALKYRLLFPSGTAVDFTATGVGTLYSVALTPATTATFTAGAATLVRWVESTGQRIVLESKPITVLADLTVATNLDGRSANAIALANARAALQRYLADGHATVLGYTSEGRTITFRSVKECTDLIEYLQRQVAAENALNAVVSGVAPGRVFTRM